MTIIRIFVLVLVAITSAQILFAQNNNSSTTEPARPRSTNTNQQPKVPTPAATPPATEVEQPSAPSTTSKTAAKKPVVSSAQPGSDGVLAAFNSLLDGIRHADVDAVMNVYWNSPRLSLFNYNGTVTKGWEQVRENRKSSYPEIKDAKLEVRDVAVTMLGREGATVTCLWTQSQIYKGNPETASGRMTLIFKRVGTSWKAIHLHSSPDNPNPTVVPPSEQTPKPSPTP